MEHSRVLEPAITIAVAMAAGMVAQSLARHLRLPGIVLLLAAGVALGPDYLDIVQPESLGAGLQILVGFAVAVILFEGGLNLRPRRLREQARVIRMLITAGALITATGGALAAHWIMGWDWTLAIPFGALVVVTGPTVVTPLLRRIKVRHKVETVLEAEGVLIDSIGAILAAISLELVLSRPSGSEVAGGALDFVTHLGFGLLSGVAGGILIALALRFRKVVPDGLENVFTLSLVLLLFQVSNAIMPESGIMAVTAAGFVVGNVGTRVQRELLEFKEQLTVLLIAMLFVLLAADVRVADVRALGIPGVITVAALMLVVRPLNVFASTLGSDLSFRERAFISWLAPRGVVAAAIASLFAQTFATEGIAGGNALRALVFAVIASTVVIQGLSGGIVARILGLRRPVNRGFAIGGANALGQALGRLLRDAGEEVVFMDNNPANSQAVKEDGFDVVYGNVLEERTLMRARLEDRKGCVAMTPNEEVNLVLGRSASRNFGMHQVWIASRRDSLSVKPSMIEEAGATMLFGAPRDIDLWTVRLSRGAAKVEPWLFEEESKEEKKNASRDTGSFPKWHNLLLPLVVQTGSRVRPVGHESKRGDRVWFAVLEERAEEARAVLESEGWRPAD